MSFVPVTPGGTLLTGLAAATEQEAIERVLKDARYMPYKSWENFIKRGYRIVESQEVPVRDPPQWYGSPPTS